MVSATPIAVGVVFCGADEDLVSIALSMRTPRTGSGEIRLGGSGPRHGPILGGIFFSRTPADDDSLRRLLSSAFFESLHT